MCNEVKIIYRKPSHSEQQGYVKRAKQHLENIIATWMETNGKRKQFKDLRFVCAMEIRAYREEMKCSSYEAMFDCLIKMWLANLEVLQELTKNYMLKKNQNLFSHEATLPNMNTLKRRNLASMDIKLIEEDMVLAWFQQVMRKNSAVDHQYLTESRLSKHSGRLLEKDLSNKPQKGGKKYCLRNVLNLK
jgi:hypothetical protein